ncbi:MAG: general secretion pathway protein GspK [Deltaproteobacteria bacterium]
MPSEFFLCRSAGKRIRRAGDRGSVLILVAWILMLLAVYAVSLGVTARQQLMLSRRLVRDAVLRRAAEAGLARARAWLSQPVEEPGGDSGAPAFWMEREDLFKGVSVGKALFSLGYAWKDPVCGEEHFFYGLADEEGKINLNTASADVLARLFQSVLGVGSTKAQELADAVTDWRDPDSGTQPRGAEDAYYESLTTPYACKDASFDAPDELLLVRGFDATIYKNIKGYVTVMGSGRLNVNTASAEALQAVGLDAKLTGKIVRYRQGPDARWGTADDAVFASVGLIASELEASGLTEQERGELEALVAAGVFTVNSSFFSATCTATLPGDPAPFSITAVFERSLTEEGYRVQPRTWRVSV